MDIRTPKGTAGNFPLPRRTEQGVVHQRMACGGQEGGFQGKQLVILMH